MELRANERLKVKNFKLGCQNKVSWFFLARTLRRAGKVRSNRMNNNRISGSWLDAAPARASITHWQYSGLSPIDILDPAAVRLGLQYFKF